MISATSNQKDDRSSEDDVTKIKRKGVMIMDKLELRFHVFQGI